MENLILLKQMMVLFLMMLIGVCCRKCHIFNDEANKRISSLVVNVANPALILSSGMNQESAIRGMEFVKTFLLAWAMYGVLVVIALVVPKVIRAQQKEYGTYKAMTLFSNIGFMGFPVIQAVYGNEALLYASLFLIPFNVLIYTYGIDVMKTSGQKEKFQLRKVLNVGVIACILSLVIYLLAIPVPMVVDSAVRSVSNLTAPLSMMIIGDSLAKINLKKLFTNGRMLVFSVIKLILIPLIGVSLIRLLGIDRILVGVCMVMLSTPVGSMTAMLAQEYGGDYELASQGVTITTILAVVTIPLVSFLLKV